MHPLLSRPTTYSIHNLLSFFSGLIFCQTVQHDVGPFALSSDLSDWGVLHVYL